MFASMTAGVQDYFSVDKKAQAAELAATRAESRDHVLTAEEKAQLKQLEADIATVREKVAKGELKAGGGGKVVRKRGSASHRAPVKLTQVTWVVSLPPTAGSRHLRPFTRSRPAPPTFGDQWTQRIWYSPLVLLLSSCSECCRMTGLPTLPCDREPALGPSGVSMTQTMMAR